MKYNIAYVTATRAEYGIMRNLLTLLKQDPNINLDVIITGTHILERYGKTINQITEDGFNTDLVIDMNLTATDNLSISESLSILTKELGIIFSRKKYDLVIILGDRYEMLPVANLSLLYNYPICHIHGGEKTLGNYDEFIRHAITKMSHLHLTATDDYKERVISLGENPNKVYNVGSMGVENALNTDFLEKEELEDILDLKLEDEYFVFLYHPVTLNDFNKQKEEIDTILNALIKTNRQIITIGGNADTGSDYLYDKICEVSKTNKKFVRYASLPTRVYHSLVKQSQGLIGNSSSGIIEVPSLKVPTLNIGDRQKGRLAGPSVYSVKEEYDEIESGISKMAECVDFFNPYEKHGSTKNAKSIILEQLKEGIVLEKEFYESK